MKILSVDLDYITNNQQNLDIYKKCLRWFDESKEIIFIKSHHLILKYINNAVDLFNIDHHHDINYDDINPFDKTTYREGDWIIKLIKHNLLKSYTWVHNFDSDLHYDHLNAVRNLKKFNYTTDLSILDNIKFDKIVICESRTHQTTSMMYETLKSLSFFHHKNKVIEDNTNNITNWLN